MGGKLQMTNRRFFCFVANIEKICESVLLPQSIKIYGDGFIDEVICIIESHDHIHEQLRKAIGEVKCSTVDMGGIQLLASFLDRAYMGMWGKDYVRQLMEKKTLTQDTRVELKTPTKHGHRFNKDSSTVHQVVCYFCGELGHSTNNCDKIKVCPSDEKENIPHYISISKKNKFLKLEWVCCGLCKRWQTTHCLLYTSPSPRD